MTCPPLLVLLVFAAGDAQPAAPLPRAWHGTWAGRMANTPARGKPSEVAMTLKIQPIQGSDAVTWVVTYGEGAKALVKNYRLVPEPGKPGRFRLDEGGGVALAARLVNGVLYSHSEVAGSLLTGRYELRDNALRFEVTWSSRPAGEKAPGQGKVQSYDVQVVQSAVLKKK